MKSHHFIKSNQMNEFDWLIQWIVIEYYNSKVAYYIHGQYVSNEWREQHGLTDATKLLKLNKVKRYESWSTESRGNPSWLSAVWTLIELN